MSESESARHALRRETAKLHTELDAMLSRANFDDRESYALFLARQAAPLFALEEAIDASDLPTSIPDWPLRRRTEAISDDLARLGSVSPSPSRAPEMSDDALMGALYVLEGSRLGAKFLVKQARASSDPVVRDATAYLGHGDGQSFWPSFLAVLAKREDAGLDHAALIDGANRAFAMFLESANAAPAEGEELRAKSA